MKTLQVRNMPKSGQAGFTIIELIVVILLLGILTATALPRFLDVTDEAHDAVVSAVTGALTTSGALFHAQWVAEGEPVAGTVLTDFGDGTLQTSAEGYPAGIGTDADDLTTNDDGTDDTLCLNLFDNALQPGHPTVAVAPTANTEPTAAEMDAASTDFLAFNAAASVCSYAYVAEGSAAANEIVTFDITSGNVTSNTTTAD